MYASFWSYESGFIGSIGLRTLNFLPLLSLNMFPSAGSKCIIGKCFVWCLMTYFILPFARFGVSAGLKYIDIFREKKVFDPTDWYWTVCLPMPWLSVLFDLKQDRHTKWFLYLVLYTDSLGSVRNPGKHGSWGPQQEILAIKHWYSWYSAFILPDFKYDFASKCGNFGTKLIKKSTSIKWFVLDIVV